MNTKTKDAIAHGVMGFGIGMAFSSFVLGKEIMRLEKKNRTSFELHKQLINDTSADLEDHTLPSGEILKRLAERLNFITVSKSI